MPDSKYIHDLAWERISAEAADWLLRTREAPANTALAAELADWLARDARHAQAWHAAQRVWSLAGNLGPAREGVEPIRALRRPRAWRWGLAMAASVLLAFGLYAPELRLRVQADHFSAVGEMRSVDLVDGSRVELDSDSAIAIIDTADRRGVKLLAGRAYFTVRPDRNRPFTVTADDVDVTVTGTEFDVRTAASAVSVAVADGSVLVSHRRGGQLHETALAAGQRLRIERDGQEDIRQVPPQLVAAWRRGRLVVESATIGELVAELRAYRSGTIVITDPALAERQVTGVFDLRDPVRALRTMIEPHAGRVREITPWLVVVSGG